MRKWILPLVLAVLPALAHAQTYESGRLKVVSRQGPSAGAATNFWNFRLTDGSAYIPMPTALGGAGGLKVECYSGCGGAAAFADASAFTFGTTSVGVFAAVVDDVATNTVAENSAGAPRMNTNRILYLDLSKTAANATAILVTGTGGTFPVTGTFWQATQPVSGTVTTTPPANASTNIAQMNGTTVSMNTGTRDAGTQRVTVATNDSVPVTGTFWQATQPVSGTVTTTPPSNASSNVTQWNGNTVTTNSGVKGAGTLQVVIATDQPALTNKLLVTPDSVALPANQSVNVAQFGGTNVVTGTGAGGAGIPRVTVSNDSTVTANAGTGTFTVAGGKTNNNAAPGATNVGTLNAVATAAAPSFTEGNQVALSVDLAGALRTAGGSGVTGTKSNNGGVPGATNLGVLGAVSTAAAPTYTEGNQVALSTDNAGALRVAGTFSAGAAADTVGTGVALNGLNVTASVVMAGQDGVGMFLAAGTLAGTITPEISFDGGTTWVATLFYDPATQTTAATIVVTNPNAATTRTVMTGGGTSHARVRVSTFTSGTATATLRATTGEGPRQVVGTVTSNQGGAPWSAVGTKSTNSVAPGSTNLGVLPAVANASAPSYTETAQVLLSTDLAGTLRTTGADTTAAVNSAAWTSATGINTTLDLNGAAKLGTVLVTYTATSTITGGVISFFGAPNVGGINVSILQCARTDTPLLETTHALAVETMAWQCPTEGYDLVRVQLTSVITGTGTVTINTRGITVPTNYKTAVVTGTVTTTPPANASTNIVQFGGTNVVTGTGAGGVGIPRVTVSNDSTVILGTGAATIGALTANQSVNVAQVGATAITAPTTQPTAAVAAIPVRQPMSCTSYASFSQTASASITGTSAQFFYICGVVVVSATAQSFSLVEGTGTNCATGVAGVIGGTTASVALAANGGFSSVSGQPWIKTATTGNNLCVLQSGAGNLSGTISYIKAP